MKSSLALTEVNKHALDVEKSMLMLIKDDIIALFPSLKLLETESRVIPSGGPRLDIITFDTSRNTFAVIEIKNKPSEEAVDQVKTYLRYMKRYRGELVLLHSKNMKCSPRDKQSFNWNEMYAIIMAPKFSENQISMANEDQTVELYGITMYNEHSILMKRVDSGHRAVPPRPANSPSDSVRSESESADRLLLSESFFTSKTNTGHMSDTIQADSPPLSNEEIKDIEDFYKHPEDRKIGTLKELFEELYSD